MEHIGTYSYDEWRRMQQAKNQEPKEDCGSDSGDQSYTYLTVKDAPPVAQAPPIAPSYPAQYNPYACNQCAYHPPQQTYSYGYGYGRPAAPHPHPVHAQQQILGQQQYYCYPLAPTQVPIQAPAQIPAEREERKAGKHLWVGRTKAQVEEDNIKVAMRENVYQYNAMKPVDPKSDQMFWCVELDGATTLRTFRTIDEDLGPGQWERDPRYGNAYFVREEAQQ